MPAELSLSEAMKLTGEARKTKLQELSENLRLEMEAASYTLKELILSQPPELLLGYIWTNLLAISLADTPNSTSRTNDKSICQVALEYIHAALSCFGPAINYPAELNEEIAKEVLATAERLKDVALLYCATSSMLENGSEFGDQTWHIEHSAKTKWVLIRGNRYQVLEEEFFSFVLEPHDDALRRVYGAGAKEIAVGIQAIASTMREGFARAAQTIFDHLHRAEKQELHLKDSTATIIHNAKTDLLYGGLCNVSRHTDLPEKLLEDLAFKRGENKEFFEPGPFCGTPLRTLPARINPLVRLEGGFYATEPQFIRDTAYRAIGRGLKSRLPDYKEEWNRRQKALTEGAFANIFSNQLKRASIFDEVFYRKPTNGAWAENDTVIILDDVLIIIEAKAGIDAMDSPAINFGNHIRAIQNLVIKAYEQARRFLEYLASSPEVILYKKTPGTNYQERFRIKLSNFRLVLPIGLTVESFAPFSAMCKELPGIEPILGKYPFMSMSIDDLFVLNRFLPTAGELFHYLDVRQQVAGIKGAHLFDEIDHLGAYITKNRFDLALRKQLSEGMTDVTLDGFSNITDEYFEGDRWLHEPPPSQAFPPLLMRILNALDNTGAREGLKVDAIIRDLDSEARENLESRLRDMVSSVRIHKRRWFALKGDNPLLIWLSTDTTKADMNSVRQQAEIITLALNIREIQALRVSVSEAGDFVDARGMTVLAPPPMRNDYEGMLRKADEMKGRSLIAIPSLSQGKQLPPNERCWCGSRKKFKKCHGSPRMREGN